jgi:hypothetical protein
VICDSTSEVRRLVFHDAKPSSLTHIELKVARWDDDVQNNFISEGVLDEAFHLDETEPFHFSRIQFRKKTMPSNSWAFPIVTGHRYRMHFGEALDFESMT